MHNIFINSKTQVLNEPIRTMNDTAINANLRAFQLKGSLLTLTVLELLKVDMPAIGAQFLSLVKQTPDLFRRMPVVIDLNKINEVVVPIDFSAIKKLMTEHGMVPVGIRGGNPTQQNSAVEVGFAVLNNHRGEKTSSTSSAKEEPGASKFNAKLVTQPVRSGQQIYAKGGDLVILTSVSPGAEVLADGNIHIYGALRGRALAGVTGNKEARIFCQKLEAELVSIAGHYWINEDLSPLTEGHTIQVYLENDRLHIGTF
jgi:septum site-determining protein MinC